MTKRVFSVLICLVLVLGTFAGCGGTTEDGTTDDSTQADFIHRDPGAADDPETEAGGVPTGGSQSGGGTNGSGSSGNQGGNGGGATPSTTTTTAAPTTVTVTIPEGFNIVKTIKRLAEKGVASEDALWKVVNGYDYSKYSLIADMPNKSGRCFKIEGYIAADTYIFNLNSAPEDVFGKMIRTMQGKLTSEMYSRARELNMSMDDVLTLASLIEKEALVTKEDNYQNAKQVSSVIHNRLKQGMKLQLDYTTAYVEGVLYPYAKNVGITDDILIRDQYSTKRCAGLPVGPVCSPSMAAINAALYPADTNYTYFVTKGDKCLFAETYEQHKLNCDELGVVVPEQ